MVMPTQFESIFINRKNSKICLLTVIGLFLSNIINGQVIQNTGFENDSFFVYPGYIIANGQIAGCACQPDVIIKGVTFKGIVGANPTVAGEFSADLSLAYNSDCANNITGNNSVMSKQCVYEENPGIFTIANLIPGNTFFDFANYEFEPLLAPSISVQPTNQSAMIGSTVSFSVTADGVKPLYYQ